jgi:adenosine deaminase
MWETLQHLAPRRIGHGVGGIADPALLAYLREHEIHLEVCPSCNVYVDHRRFETYGDHPVHALYDAGISISVNSDVRTLVPVRPDEQYEQLHQVFGWGKEQFLQCNLNALHAAFVPEPVKEQLVGRLLQGYGA